MMCTTTTTTTRSTTSSTGSIHNITRNENARIILRRIMTKLLIFCWMATSLSSCYDMPSSSSTSLKLANAFQQSDLGRQPRITPILFAAKKGFGGGGGFMKKKNNNKSAADTKRILLKLVKQKYGGTSPQDIARGTQGIIDAAIQELPEHIQLALRLYRQQVDWNRRTGGMDSLLTQSPQLSPQVVSQAVQGQEMLDALKTEHSLSTGDLQVIMQQITWNASADAKAARSLTGTMPLDIQNRVQRACYHAAEAVTKDSGDRSVLDVGCGYGVLVPYLKKAGITSSQICGMDLSSGMIKNAQSFYPDVHFEVTNFVDLDASDTVNNRYNAILFCAALHDMPNMEQTLNKASSLLTHGGKLIIVHAQGGAAHVARQHISNPMLVPRGLPTAAELQEWLCSSVSIALDDNEKKTHSIGMELTVAPAEAKSRQDIIEGYLAVLTKR